MTYYRGSEASREAGITYHLVPVSVWESQRSNEWYTPEAFERDGFIHCTNGIDQLVTVANSFYVTDPRPFRVLALNKSAIRSDVRYDDDARLFPHIYGPLNTDSVVGELTVVRADDGAFVSIDE